MCGPGNAVRVTRFSRSNFGAEYSCVPTMSEPKGKISKSVSPRIGATSVPHFVVSALSRVVVASVTWVCPHVCDAKTQPSFFNASATFVASCFCSSRSMSSSRSPK